MSDRTIGHASQNLDATLHGISFFVMVAVGLIIQEADIFPIFGWLTTLLFEMSGQPNFWPRLVVAFLPFAVLYWIVRGIVGLFADMILKSVK